jgi:membrane-associated phospholipid phosphatase
MNAPRATPWRTLCLLNVFVALVVSLAVWWWGVLPGEAGLRVALRGASPGVLEVADAVSGAGTWRALVPATLLLLTLSGYARRRWWLWSGLLVSTPLVGELWQEAVGRPRPGGLALGFPSGHAIAVATYAVLLCYLVGRTALSWPWRLGIAALAVGTMAAVGLARIVRDSHWAADVVVGFALGSAGAAAAAWWDRRHPLPAPLRAPDDPRVLSKLTEKENS